MRTISAHSAPEPARADFVGSLAAGLRVLAAFTPARPELGVNELARILDDDKRRTQRLISTLYQLGYLSQDEKTRKYRPGLKVLNLGYTVLSSLDIREIARPYLNALLSQFGQSVNLAVRDGREIVFIECLRGADDSIGIRVNVGERRLLQYTSLGKAIMAGLDDRELEPLLDNLEFSPPTPYGVRNRNDLMAQLQDARTDGFAIMDQEVALGVRSVAAFVGPVEEPPVAAINVAVPTPLVPLEQLRQIIGPEVARQARLLSSNMVESLGRPARRSG